MSDDVIYALLLILSLLLGFAVRHGVTSYTSRQIVMTSIGVALVVLVCGWNGLHSAVVSFVTAAIIHFVKTEHCHVATFAWCFGYLAFFQSANHLGFPAISGPTNALQILMTLKLVGVAFEIHDSAVRRREQCDHQQSNGNSYSRHLLVKYRSVSPSPVDILCYSYCFIGLFTGPYFTFRVYYDFLNSGNTLHKLNAVHYIRKHYLWTVVVSGAAYVILSQYFSFQEVRSDEFFYKTSVWYLIFYMTGIFTLFRVRLYLAFIVADCACVTSGLGGYPASSKPRLCEGPSDLETHDSSKADNVLYDFTTVHSVDVMECELAPTMQLSIRTWNRTVQYWLTAYVYKRLPFSSTPLKLIITMLVSAYWHGLHPGYYLTFLFASVYLFVEKQLLFEFCSPVSTSRDHTNNEIKVKRHIKPLTGYTRWISWFLRTRASEYLGIGFEMKTLIDTLRFWRYLYFAGHVVLLSALAGCVALTVWRKNADRRHLIQGKINDT